MVPKRLAGDERAVSTVVGYVLGLVIASLLVSGLFVAGGNVLADQQTAAATTGFEVAGERVATGYADADRLVEAAGPSTSPTIEVAVPIRSRIAGDGYTVRVTGAGGGDPPYTATIHLENTDGSATYTTRVVTHTPISDASIAGGPIVIQYDEGSGELHLERGTIG